MGKKTYADMANKIIAKYAKRGDSDAWANTAKEMQMKQLMNSQEMERKRMGIVDGNQKEMPMMKYGGKTYGGGRKFNAVTGQWEEEQPYPGPYSAEFLNTPAGQTYDFSANDIATQNAQTKLEQDKIKGLTQYQQFQQDNSPEAIAASENQAYNQYFSPEANANFRDSNPITYGTQAAGKMGQEDKPKTPGKKFDYKSYLTTAAGLAPAAYNLYQGLKKEDRLNASDYQTKKTIKPYKLNFDPTKNAALDCAFQLST